jgi:hypothetical protein
MAVPPKCAVMSTATTTMGTTGTAVTKPLAARVFKDAEAEDYHRDD